MPRLHLVELEDLPWFPATVRDLATDFLRFMAEVGGGRPLRPIAARLHDALQRTGSSHIVDLCSGGGGPVLALWEQLRQQGCHVQVTLTDAHPNRPAALLASQRTGGAVQYAPEPVDAFAVPQRYAGFRTLFNALHHFRPRDAQHLLRDAVQQRRPIAVFEVPQRTPLGIAIALLLNPIALLLATPFIRPFRWRRLLWTYLLPAVPLLVWWDGLVSALRAYSPGELRRMVDALGPNDYTWQVGRDPMPFPYTYLIGCPPLP